MASKKFLIPFLFILGLFLQTIQFNNILVPVTGIPVKFGGEKEFRSAQAVAAETNSNSFAIKGISSRSKFNLSVTYQPAGSPGFVTTSPEAVTFFSTAVNYGSIGIIAHNYLAGSEFFELRPSNIINLSFADGHVETYIVNEVREYQALTPTSPYSSFINLANPSEIISYRDLFFETYGVNNRLVLQTCISKNNDDSWGRLFIIATPIKIHFHGINHPLKVARPLSNGVYSILLASR